MLRMALICALLHRCWYCSMQHQYTEQAGLVYGGLCDTRNGSHKHCTSPLKHGVHKSYRGAGGTVVAPVLGPSCS